MQLISSLINLQLRHTVDNNVISELKDAKSRFSALCTLNKIIFESEKNHQKLNINTLVNRTVKCIINQYGEVDEHLASFFIINTDIVAVDTEKAIPLGLIINELLLFSIKNKMYLSGKEITINLDYCFESNRCKFIFENNHAPVDWNMNFDNTLSEKIIVRLTNQLQSEMKIDYDKKMKFSFSF